MQNHRRSLPGLDTETDPVSAPSALLTAATSLLCFALSLVGMSVLTGAVPAAASGSHSFGPSDVPRAVVSGPVTGGKGIDLLGTTSFDLRTVGYEQNEYFLSGTADAYGSATALTRNGRWMVAPTSTAPYKTRVVVYRPSDPRRFDGTVVVEWLNVSGGVDAGAAWLTDHVQMIRSGMAYVGVSAQATGVDALKSADPSRYSSLNHPGDSFSYSIYQQAGAAIRRDAATILNGLHPKRLLALGESQSALRLVTYVDALGPGSHGVFDGYFVYSSSAISAPLSQAPQPSVATPTPTFIRTDLDVPVMLFETETDLIFGGYRLARQAPTRHIREWEVAGTAHYDSYGLVESMTDTGNGDADVKTFDTMVHPVSSNAGAITCASPFNAGAHTYELRAAVVALNTWAITGRPPPQSPRIVLDGSSLVTNHNGEAVGGIRTPQVQAPIAVVSGVGATAGAGSGFCVLFGRTVPFSPSKLAALYPTHASFVRRWDRAVDADLASGYLLPADAKVLKRVAAGSAIGG
jgi:Alpha/beta hydrolase domain